MTTAACQFHHRVSIALYGLYRYTVFYVTSFSGFYFELVSCLQNLNVVAWTNNAGIRNERQPTNQKSPFPLACMDDVRGNLGYLHTGMWGLLIGHAHPTSRLR